MASTKKRMSLALTKEDLREIDLLCKLFEENPSQVIRRAITLLHYINFHNKNNRSSQ